MQTLEEAKPRLKTRGTRLPHPSWLARFREIEPTAELLYLGDNAWVLGSVSKTDERVDEGAAILAFQKKLPPERRKPGLILKARALMEGFAPVTVYEEHQLVNGQAFADFEVRDFNWRNTPDSTFLADLDGHERRAEKEKLRRRRDRRAGHIELHRQIVKNPRSFHVNRTAEGEADA